MEPTKTFYYHDVDGRVLYGMVKFPGKNFRRFRPGQNGEKVWNWEDDPRSRVPYGLPSIQTESCIIVEGEKDAQALIDIGLPGTCIPGGSSGPNQVHNDFWKKYFSRYQVVYLLPDRDKAGEKYVDDIGRALKNVVPSISVVRLPGLDSGGDVSDWLHKHPGSPEAQAAKLEDAIYDVAEDWIEPETKILSQRSPRPGFNPNIDLPQDLEGTHKEILAKLPNGSFSGNTWNCVCPAHSDKRASLSVTLAEDKILVRCHAGCSTQDVLQTIGVKMHQLFRRKADHLAHVQQTVHVPRPGDMERICKSILIDQAPDEFDLSSLPPILRNYATDAAKLTEASPIIIVSAALCSFAAQAGTKLVIPKGTYFVRLFPNTWVLCIDRSGSYKTTGLNMGSAVLGAKENSVIREINDLLHRIRSAVDAGVKPEDDEDLQYNLNLLEQFKSQRRILPAKSSWEACLNRIGETGGGCWLLSEFGSWLASLESQHNKGLRQMLTELYDVPTYFEEVTISRGSKILENPTISIAGVSTIEFLQGLLTAQDAGSGFLARFLLFRPPPSDAIPAPRPMGTTSISDCDSYQLLDQVYRSLDHKTVQTEYGVSEKAWKLFDEYHEGLFKRLQDTDGNLQKTLDPFIKRWSPGALKTAITCQYLMDPNATEISEAAMLGGISVNAYAEQCTRYLFSGELGETQHQSKQSKVVTYIAERGGEVTWQRLNASKKLGGGHAEYDYVLKSLEEAGRLAIERVDGKIKAGSKILLVEA